MTFEEAVVQMMRKYWKGSKHGGFETTESFKSAKYTKEYFDKLKEEFTGVSSKDYEDNPKKKRSKNGY